MPRCGGCKVLAAHWSSASAHGFPEPSAAARWTARSSPKSCSTTRRNSLVWESTAVNSLPVREIVFDTETTGLNPLGGDRMVEIGCVEMLNRVETGRHFHAYFNPERQMPSEAEAVHGLTTIFLSDKPRFV